MADTAEVLRKLLAAGGIIAETYGKIGLAKQTRQEKKDIRERELNRKDRELVDKRLASEGKAVDARVKQRQRTSDADIKHNRAIELLQLRNKLSKEGKQETLDQRYSRFIKGDYEPTTDLETLVFSGKLKKELEDSGLDLSSLSGSGNGAASGAAAPGGAAPTGAGTPFDFYNEIIRNATPPPEEAADPGLTDKQQQTFIQDEFEGSVERGEKEVFDDIVARIGEIGSFSGLPQLQEKVPKNSKELIALISKTPSLLEDSTIVAGLEELDQIGSPEHQRAFKGTADSLLIRDPRLAKQIFTKKEITEAEVRISSRASIIKRLIKKYGQDQWDAETAESQEAIIQSLQEK